MLNDRVIVNKKFANSFVKFIGNPIVALALGVLVSIFFFVISISQRAPYYFLSQPKLEAIQSNKDLKLQFNSKLIKNLYSIDLILWNNGGQFIDQSDFVDSKPISLICNSSTNLLASNIVVKSRPDLKFSDRISKDTLHIYMIGDEAIEEGDGAVVRVYYTLKENKPPRFSLSSRIKGTKLGFEYKDLKKFDRKIHTPILVTGWAIIILLISIRVVVLLIAKKPIVFRKIEVVVLLVAICLWSYYTYEYIYYAIDLPWTEKYLK